MFGARKTTAQPPLLDAEELRALALQAASWQPRRLALEVHDHHAGEWPTTRLGHGLEFEEVRVWQPGDDARAIDWRSSARRGQWLMRSHREERQPLWHVVVDRSPSMHFGTRRRLKLAQAARLAILLAHAAQLQGAAIGFSLWDRQDVQLPAGHGSAALARLLPALIGAAAPSPPYGSVPKEDSTARLATRLLALRSALPAGTRLWILSDGYALFDDACVALVALRHWLSLRWLLVHDPAERSLPEGRSLWLAAEGAGPRRISATDPGVQHVLDALWQRRLGCLQRAGVNVRPLATTAEFLLDVLDQAL